MTAAVLADVLVAQNIFFVMIGASMVLAALRMVTTKNIVHAALYLVVVLAGVAALFVLTLAEFTAATQVLVYIGAVIVLFLFGIMLTRAPMHPDETLDNDLRWPGAAAALFLAGILGTLLVRTFHADKLHIQTPVRTSEVTNAIFRVYIIPFEVVGVLLLGALIGAVVLARRD
jgi:NADH-quinone oxidoreductase subunit J